jgi:hypothetical protein
VPVSPTIVDMESTTEGPNGDSKQQYVNQHCGFMFVGKKQFLSESPRSHVKLANIK